MFSDLASLVSMQSKIALLFAFMQDPGGSDTRGKLSETEADPDGQN